MPPSLPSDVALRLESQLCHPLYSAANALQRVYKRLLEPLDVTYPQYLILMALWEQDGVNLQAIGEATHFDSGTLTPLMQKLKDKGLVELKPLKEDRRNKLVVLTRKGRQLKDKAASIPEALSCLLPFHGAEFVRFKEQVEKLYRELVAQEAEMK